MKNLIQKIVLSVGICVLSTQALALELNSASAQQLVALKGIGEKTANAILQERQRAGPFMSLEDFSIRIKGMGKKRLQNLVNQGLYIDPTTLPSQWLSSNPANSLGHEAKYQPHQEQSFKGKAVETGSRVIGGGQIKTAQPSAIQKRRLRQPAGSHQAEIAEPQLIKPPKP